jgi:hypothetical protein
MDWKVKKSEICEQVCTDICQQTTAKPAVFLYLSLYLSLPRAMGIYNIQHPKKGGRKGNKEKEKKTFSNPRQEIQFLKPP